MVRGWKRVLAAVLTAVLVFNSLPAAAFAEGIDAALRGGGEILGKLKEITGSDEEAQTYYTLLERYGLLDEGGTLAESWTIERAGEPVTLEDIRAELEGDYDPASTVTVDGTAVTMADLAAMLEIEDYISYLRNTYYTEGEWTPEQLEALASLQEQVSEEGIELLSADPDLAYPSGVNHALRLEVNAPDTATAGTYEVTVSLADNKTCEQDITFDYAALPGSIEASGSGTATIPAGKTSATFSVTVGGPTGKTEGDGVFGLSLFNAVNARFSGGQHGGTAWNKAVKVAATSDFKYQGSQDFTINCDGDYFWRYTDKDGKEDKLGNEYLIKRTGSYYLEEDAYAEVGVEGLSEGSYAGEVRLTSGEFSNVDIPKTPLWHMDDWRGLVIDGVETYYWHLLNNPRPVMTLYVGGEQVGSWLDHDALPLGCDEYSIDNQRWEPQTEASLPEGDVYAGDVSGDQDSRYRIGIGFIAGASTVTNGDSISWKVGEYKFFQIPRASVSGTVSVTETTTSTTATLSAPEGTFVPGQKVPVTVDFGFPMVINEDMSLTFNEGATEQTVKALEVGATTNKATFLYEVTSADGTSIDFRSAKLDGVGANGRDVTVTVPEDGHAGLAAAKLATPDHRDAVTGISVELGGTPAEPVLDITAQLAEDGKITAWLMEELANNLEEHGTAFSSSFAVSCAGKDVLVNLSTDKTDGITELTAQIPIDPNTGEDPRTHIVELYLDGEVVLGSYATVDQEPVVFVTADDVALEVAVRDKAGNEYEYADDTETIYVQDAPSVTGSFTVKGDNFAFGNRGKTTVWTVDAASGEQVPLDPDADFIWGTTDETVLVIDEHGIAIPTGKAGKARVTLTAWNGGIADKAVTVESEELAFGVGLTPFLLIPNNALTAEAEQEMQVFWTSNLCDKNGAEPTGFKVEVTRDGTPDGAGPVFATTVEGTKDAPASMVRIPAGALTYEFGQKNAFTVQVSSSYNGKEYAATASITLNPRPAKVTLGDLPSYYITDAQGGVNVSWSISDFERALPAEGGEAADPAEPAEELFELRVTRDGAEEPVYVSNDPGAGADGVYQGSWTLAPAAVGATADDPTSYRDVYTVTVKAKNGTDSTWSYDSFVLYVYDANALKIMVDGATAGDELVMSNREAFSQMSQEEILAYKRDINLRNVISANYGEYAWAEVADQISWASSNSDVASMNYQQGTLYENIENFAYTSYRPTTDFVLSGLKDGSATVTAQHKLTQMADTVDVTVETMKDRLYLFQCYPQTTTTLTFEEWTNAEHTEKRSVEIESDETGAAAYYAEFGIASDVWCESEVDGATYLGTFYLSQLETGERDSTKLELYPCNNLQLRRAAYAYLYLKNPDGTPYTGDITFRGGVYVNDEYRKDALFQLNGGSAARAVNLRGDEDQKVALGADGRLEVVMDQTQWGLEGGALKADDQVRYMFQIEQGDGSQTEYYPLLTGIDATANEDAFVGSGEAAVSFRANNKDGKHPFIASQVSSYANTGTLTDMLGKSGSLGPSDSCPEARLTTAVMWWGEDKPEDSAAARNALVLVDGKNRPIAAKPGEFEAQNTAYPFSDILITQHMVRLNEQTLSATLAAGESTKLKLNYYADGKTLTRSEELPFKLVNMIGMGKIEEQSDISEFLTSMGKAAGTDAATAAEMDPGDEFFGELLELVASDDYTTGDSRLFSIKLAPTSDPTKFLGFIEVNIGNMSDADQVTGVYAQPGETSDFDYMPGLGESLMLVGAKTPFNYAWDQMSDYYKATKSKAVKNISFDFGGYAESLICYNENTGKWEVQILDGGFNAGGGSSFSWNFNAWCGPIPFTATLTAGGTGEVSMDALTAAYRDAHTGTKSLGTDFLTQLRLYLYLRFFAGVGFDYSIVAFKLGVYGQVNADLQFQWLNRPHQTTGMVNSADGDTDPSRNGQHYAIDGQIGLEFLIKLLFISYEQVLVGNDFNLYNGQTGDWDKIQYNWDANSKAMQDAIGDLVDNGSADLVNVGGRQMVSLNMAPTMEDRSYLVEGGRSWGPGWSLFSLDSGSAIDNLESNTYPYANPVVSDDGQLVAYLSDMGDANVEKTRAKVGERSGGSFTAGVTLPTPAGEENDGFGDSQVALSGTGEFAVAAWTRQTVSINKDEGAVLTDADQLMMLDSTDVYASVKTGSGWKSVRLSDNSHADLAPVVATNGKSGDAARAIVAWRSVETEGIGEDGSFNPTDFGKRDAIVYRVFNGTEWGAEQTLYNGTSGAVKALVATMMDDGTAAVAYTLDKDGQDSTSTDREIAYAVVGPAGAVAEESAEGTDGEDDPADDAADPDAAPVPSGGEVLRSVQVTSDAYLDENPQIASVRFGDTERFVLGWYTEESVATDAPAALNGGSEAASAERLSDIRLIDFDAAGNAGQMLPDSLNQVADSYGVTISNNFRFAKNAQTIDDLSILWVERAETEPVELGESGADGSAEASEDAASALEADHDLLRAVKFYTTGQNDELVRLTGAIDVADMEDAAPGTLIDHFDAYVDNAADNTIKAVILASTYGANGQTVSRTGQTVAGDTVSYQVPKRTTSMYTATERYGDVLEVPNMIVDWETVRTGATAQFQFTVENAGIHAINRVEIKAGDTVTVHEDLNLMPGDAIQLRADYAVPADGVVDPTYTVTATFDADAGATGTAELGGSAGFLGIGARPGTNVVTGTAYLDLPDVEITDASIVSERDGKRVIQAKLYNHADAALNGSGRAVRVGFYTDAACETPLESVGEGGSITIDDDASLAMIDEGGYALQETFDIAAFMTDGEGAVNEIPDTGIGVYLKAEVLDTEQNGRAVQGEPIMSDNYGTVRCDNLAVRTGEEASISADLESDGKDTAVNVELQNNRLASKTSGNLIVMLLDEDGNVIAEQQSYRKGAKNDGLIELAGEEIATRTFTFKGVTGAADVRVTYSDAVLDASDAALAQLDVDGVDLERTEGADGVAAVYTGSMTDLPRALVTVAAANPEATVSVEGPDGEPVEFATEHTFTGEFAKGENVFTITVTAPDGTRAVYRLVLNHTVTTDNAALADLSVSGVELSYDAEAGTFTGSGTELAGGELTVRTEDPRATVTVNGEPYTEGMELAFALGENVFEIAVTSVDGSNTVVYTLVIQNNERPQPGEDPRPGGDQQDGSSTGQPDGGPSSPGGQSGAVLPGTGDTAWVVVPVALIGAVALVLGVWRLARRPRRRGRG